MLICAICVSCSLLQKARTGKTRVQQELLDREGVERGLSLVKSWIQDSRELLLNPTSDLDILTQELEVKKKIVKQYSESNNICFKL